MKKSLLFFVAICFILPGIFSQPLWMYNELTSGVTTNLTSASSNSINYNNAQVWVCGNNGVILKSTNTGMNWVNQTGNGIPLNINLTSICFVGIDTAVAAGNNGNITFVYRTVNGGTNWTQVFTQTNGFINAIAFKNSSLGFLSGNPVGGRWSLWKTTNKGLTWDSAGMYLPQAGSETGFPNSIAARHNYVVFGTNNYRVYRSVNNGVNWSSLVTPEQNTSSIWIYADTSQFSFSLAGGSKVFRSTNSGIVWQQNPCPDSMYNIVGFAPGVYGVFDSQPMCIYACRNNNKIYFAFYATGNFNAEYTAPSGNYNYMSCDYNQIYMQLGYSFAVRNNGGITRVFYFRGGGIKLLSSVLPDKYELEQNYPNPFNPVTVIRFAVRKYGLAKLTVYDVTGREIFNPVNELLRPGLYEVSWDAASFASGTYFYRLLAEGFTETKKMILIK